MTDLKERIEHGKFVGYPTHCVVGVVDDEAGAAEAVKALAAAKFPNQVAILRGVEGAEEIDPSGEKHGILARLIRLLQFTTMDGEQAERYASEARADHSVVFVHLENYDHVQEVREILKKQGGHFINWYDRLYFEMLDD